MVYMISIYLFILISNSTFLSAIFLMWAELEKLFVGGHDKGEYGRNEALDY